jgi:hypothetical protein
LGGPAVQSRPVHAWKGVGAARSCADIVADQPAAAPEAGHPIGNGRMGTTVWTSPEAIHFQINRVDVFAVDRDHRGLPEYRGGRTDFCGGIAGVVVAGGVLADDLWAAGQ